MSANAAHTNDNLVTVIPTEKAGDVGDAEIVKPLMDSAFLTAAVQSDAPSRRKRDARTEERATKVIV